MIAPRKNARKTRGRPFAKGNSGRPRGARDKATQLAEKLMSDDVEGVVKKVIASAIGGDMTAARIVLDRLVPVRKGAPVALSLPAADNAQGIAGAIAALIGAMGRGEVSPDEANLIAGVLESQRRALELTEIEARLKAIEERIADGK